eukprot:7726-Eustigmatos_ZCMA.PRE.1
MKRIYTFSLRPPCRPEVEWADHPEVLCPPNTQIQILKSPCKSTRALEHSRGALLYAHETENHIYVLA